MKVKLFRLIISPAAMISLVIFVAVIISGSPAMSLTANLPPVRGLSMQGISPIPTPPSKSASLASWKEWSVLQHKWEVSQPWSRIFANQGYKLEKISYVIITNSSLGLPAGISETGATGKFSLAIPSSAGSSSSTTSSSPATVTPLQSTNPSCLPATGPGNVCIGAGSGFPTPITATYTYGGSSYIIGHVELGGGGCPGSAIVNSADTGINSGQTVFAQATTTSSNTWSSTFWDKVGSGYNYWGSVCANY